MHNQAENEQVTTIIDELRNANSRTVAIRLSSLPLHIAHSVIDGFTENGVWRMFAQDSRHLGLVLHAYSNAVNSTQRMALGALLTAIVAQESIVYSLYNNHDALRSLISALSLGINTRSVYTRTINQLINTILRQEIPFFANCSEIINTLIAIDTNEAREAFIHRLAHSGHLESCEFDFERLDRGFFPNDSFETLLQGFKNAQPDIPDEQFTFARVFHDGVVFTAEESGTTNLTNRKLGLFCARTLLDIERNPRVGVSDELTDLDFGDLSDDEINNAMEIESTIGRIYSKPNFK